MAGQSIIIDHGCKEQKNTTMTTTVNHMAWLTTVARKALTPMVDNLFGKVFSSYGQPYRPVGTNLELVRRVRGKNLLSMKAERLMAWGPWARSRAPGGVQGQSPSGGPGGSAPGAPGF